MRGPWTGNCPHPRRAVRGRPAGVVDSAQPVETFEADSLDAFLKDTCGGEVLAVYGASLGGAVALELVRFGRTRGANLVLDGVVKLTLGPFLPLLAAPAARLGQAVIEGHGAWFLKLAGVTPEAFHDLVYRDVSVTSLRNAFVEGFGMFDGLRDAPVRTDLRVDCWYGDKEKGAPAGVRALRQRFPRVTERVIPAYGHGEILKHPSEFVDALVSLLEGEEAQESG